MTRHPSARPLLAIVIALLASGCVLPFPPFFPMAPGFPIGEESRVTVINDSDVDAVVTFEADFPVSFAVAAGESGNAPLYGGVPTSVVVADAECEPLAELALEPGAEPAEAFRIGNGTVTQTDAPDDADALPDLFEHFECSGFGGTDVRAGDPAPGVAGTMTLNGEDARGYLLDPATAELTLLGGEPGAAMLDAEFTRSPDGERLAFARFDSDGSQAVYVENLADGGEPRLAVDDAASPAWSPDGTQLAAIRYDPFEGGPVLVLAGHDGGELRELAREAGAFAWSPDGSRIAFITTSAENPTLSQPEELRLVDVASGESTTLSQAAPYALAPAWSPDGDRIAYAAGPMDATQIHVIAADGGEPMIIEPAAGETLGEAAWSPDGTRLAIAFTGASLFTFGGGIALVDRETGERSTLITGEGTTYGDPTWSPDGAHLAAVRIGEIMATELVVIDVADGTETTLASAVMTIGDWR